MILRNSFWADIKENNKRRIWLWMVSFLFWFFYYPVGMAMLMSRQKNQNVLEGLTGKAAKLELTATAGALFGNQGIMIFVILFAVVSAIQGFSYLYSRKKVDMYHSVPVKKSTRFAVIFVNGIGIYLIPYIVNLLLALIVAEVNGGIGNGNIKIALLFFLWNLVLYMGVYGLTVIAVMLTGNLIITLFATAIFLFYEVAVRLLVFECQSSFFQYYSYNSFKLDTILSPVGKYWNIVDAFAQVKENYGEVLKAQSSSMIAGIILAAAFTVIGYLCYRIRPAEAAGKAMAFSKTKPVVKLFLTVPFSLEIALIVRSIVGAENSAALVIFGMAAAVILSNCIIEIIYEADIKAAFRKKYQILISGACVAVIYSVFCFDLTGYDAWIPKAEKLEGATFLFSSTMYNGDYVDADLNIIPYEEYALTKPEITDVEAICELSGKKVSKPEEAEGTLWCEVAYKMKNGKLIWREFPVSMQEEELLNRIIGTRQYKESVCQIYDDEIFAKLEQENIKEITFSNGMKVENLPVESLNKFREAYIKDLEKADYSTRKDEFMCGSMEMSIELDHYRHTWFNYDFSYDIYPSYTNTLAFLKEYGINPEKYAKADEIEEITVTNYHYDLAEKWYQDKKAEGDEEIGSEYVSVTKTFTDRKQIEELAEALYPTGLYRGWKMPGAISSDYYVVVRFKGGNIDSANYRGSNEAHLITAKIPGWLADETAYK